ncbi:MAG: hypothetical protein ACTSYA_02375 [Candidatus Kariarchaeaceae archaeon]
MTFKELGQRDGRWGNIKLGYGRSYIKNYGCTLTCLSIFAGITPDELNTKLKGSSYETSAFAGSSKNLINWTKLEALTNGLIKFHWRGWKYDNNEVKKAIEKYGACLVEVDFDGTPRTNDRHWILLIGNKKAIDPWTGNEIPTNKYSIYTGYAVIEVKRDSTQAQDELTKMRLERDANWNKYKEQYAKSELLITEIKKKDEAIQDVRGQLVGAKKKSEEIQDEYNSFRDKVSSKIGCPSDKVADIMEKLEINQEENTRDKKRIKELEISYKKLQDNKQEEMKQLKAEIDQLKRVNEEQTLTIEKQTKHIDRLAQRLEKIEDDETVLPKKVKRWEIFVNYIKELLNKRKV